MTQHNNCSIVGLKSLKSLARILELSLQDLLEFSQNIKNYYKKKEITKKNGDIRHLSVPVGKLRKIQAKILSHLKNFKLHSAAYGAVPKRCHVDNAKQHAAAPYVLCFDFDSFFPSVSARRINQMFIEELDCSPPVASILTKLTTYKYKLPTGSPTSPVLTNILCLSLDKRLSSLAQVYDLKYTRFVDDLTFSGRSIPDIFIVEVKKIIESFGLPLNKDKEVLLTPNDLKLVTGINVNAKKVKVSRKYKRALRAQIHQLDVLDEYRTKAQREKEESRIFGKQQYIKMVKTR
ncbi:reverse transcriptase family protein [Maridesulfovibrio zosterae]|uniref:reverse transcriptase family protein n=1 Tax=Maridesulfovibrio zosterae TaxID=82171 RepID=UPI00041F6E9C|nr:reverse transcriptase family protein [Maridesulfovibrio zosterae]